jgi:hypothetical protein
MQVIFVLIPERADMVTDASPASSVLSARLFSAVDGTRSFRFRKKHKGASPPIVTAPTQKLSEGLSNFDAVSHEEYGYFVRIEAVFPRKHVDSLAE